MRQSIPVIICLLLLMPTIQVAADAEEPLGWAITAGGFDEEKVAGHVILDDDSTIIAGEFTSAITFDDSGIGAVGFTGDADMFLAHADSNGSWTVSEGYGSEGADGIDAIVLHESGDLIIAGHFCLGTAGLACTLNMSSGISLSKTSDGDEGNAFVARMHFNGAGFETVWARQVSNPSDLSAVDIALNPSGGIAVSILHTGMLELDTIMVPGSGGISLAIIHYDENGIITWANGVGSPGGMEPFGALCYSDDGYLHVVGTFLESVMFIEMEESNGGADIFVTQLDGDGNFTWALTAGGIDDDWATDCVVDSQGDIRMVGQFAETASFGEINVTSNGWWDLFHARITSSGLVDSVVSGGGGGWESLDSIILDSRDNAYVVGSHTANFTLGADTLTDSDSNGDRRDIIVAQMTENDDWVWALSAGGSGDDRGVSVQLGANESPVIGAVYTQSITLANQEFNAQGYEDLALWLYARDHDDDGITDGSDNCPRDANPTQSDWDEDGWGDVCDDDDDEDGVGDDWDDCALGEKGWVSTPESDHDVDGCKDSSEDLDDDEDGILDQYDECQLGPVGWVSTITNDEDQNGCEDIDTDGDGFVDQLDKCPTIQDDQADLDSDGIGDACEDDTDGDGVLDVEDNCPRDDFTWDSTYSLDYDSDGCRDEDWDTDDDEDGSLDLFDSCPYGEVRWNSTEDYDGDGCRDGEEDIDEDGDNVLDEFDNCPQGIIGPAGVGMDVDRDGCVDPSEDDDDDNDGVLDADDECDYTPIGSTVDSKGCTGHQLDDDNDGVSNVDDLCPASPAGTIVTSTGCKVSSSNNGPTDSVSSDEDEEDTDWFIFGLFSLAALLIAGAVIVYFLPVKEISIPTPERKETPQITPEITPETAAVAPQQETNQL